MLVHAPTGRIADSSSDLEALSDLQITAQAIGFAAHTVRGGTDHGLYAYDRARGTWSGYAVQGALAEVSVQKIFMEEETVSIHVQLGDRERVYRLDAARGRWTEKP
ncbi:MAG: hypothetical protein HYU36_06550 [Planctomycetes bacterium]|nr:hypothetical protein [Planctomycetota bacterium]